MVDLSTNYDSLQAWLAAASEDEIAEALIQTYDEDQLAEIVQELDRWLAANPLQ